MSRRKVAVEGSSFGSREKEVLFIYRLTSLKQLRSQSGWNWDIP